ncbi:MAG: ATP-binding protein [Brevundimonas sp.]
MSEKARLQALRDQYVLDTAPEARFDRITAMAAAHFRVPIALVSLIDADRQWFKSRIGLAISEMPRALSLCDHAIRQGGDAVFLVRDAKFDPRFAGNPLVTGPPFARFFAGAVLTTESGHNLGTLCVIDTAPRPEVTEADFDHLKVLAKLVVDQLDLGRARQGLAEQRRLLDMAQILSGVGHWRYDVASARVEWSDEVFRIHGLPITDPPPPFAEVRPLYHRDDRAHVTGLLEAALATGEGYECRTRVCRPDGQERLISAKVETMGDDQGRVVALFGVFQDITEHDEAQKNLRASEARYRLPAENTTDIILRFGSDGVVRYASPACRRMGHSPETLERMAMIDLIHPEDRAFAHGLIRNLFSTQRVDRDIRRQYRALRGDGTYVWLEGNPSLIHDADGRAVEVVSVYRDMTAHRALEDSLARAKAEAEAAAAIKSEFLSNMSHELRTPLTSILGFSSLLDEEPGLSPMARRSVDRIAGSSQALLTIVNDILDFTRLEAGQVEIDCLPVDVRGLLEGTLGLFEPQAAAKALALDLIVAAGLPRALLLDPGRVRQVLLNLVGNAVKFTDTGAVTLTARYDAPAARLRCEVADTGPGIPVERAGRLFKRFSQVDGSTTRSHGGTGLGLAISRGLVEAMGGTIGATARPGGGSLFWFDLPCTPTTPAATSPRPVSDGGGLEGLRLLVVDDSAMNREIIARMLAPRKVQVTEAASGQAAVDLAATTPFDVILMDIRMPGLDGPGATRAIRQAGGPNRTTPILAFTAESDNAGGKLGWASLFNDRVAKPVLVEDLAAKLRRWGLPDAGDGT